MNMRTVWALSLMVHAWVRNIWVSAGQGCCSAVFGSVPPDETADFILCNWKEFVWEKKGLENSGPSSPTLIKTGAAMVLSITPNSSLDLRTEAAYSRLADFRTSHDENKQRWRSVSIASNRCLWFLFSFSLFSLTEELDFIGQVWKWIWQLVKIGNVGSVAYNCVVLQARFAAQSSVLKHLKMSACILLAKQKSSHD